GDSLFNRSVYFRGALALHALREKVGDDAFFTILKTYASTYQYKNATIEDFITLSEEISGMELDQLFNSWLYDEYIPDLPELELYREDFIPQN
ncbi:MAG: M1 family aminopeptidase, partial [Anaerolineae bacterium]|nr:M1 family aminopeptidase [Anaerolineae bacterium]